MISKRKKIPLLYFLFVVVVLSVWLNYMYTNEAWNLLSVHIAPLIIMFFGAFIAGSSPEGSAAIAYPVFTLYLGIAPEVARNFAFAIQSIGMTAATLLILGLRLKIDWTYIAYVSISGLVGLIFAAFIVVPHIAPGVAKLLFVSLWLAFGLILWKNNQSSDRMPTDHLVLDNRMEKWLLILFGIAGGAVSAVFGTGINILTFCLLVTYFRMSEKVATPSSIIIMTAETIVGFGLHLFILKDMQPLALEMWLACIPVVVFLAPLGSYFMWRITRVQLVKLLTVLLVVQYFAALWVIKPNAILLLASLLSVAFGLFVFRRLEQAGLKRKIRLEALQSPIQ